MNTGTLTQGGYTHTDRLSTQACWRQNKFGKKRPKCVKKYKIGPKALRDKAKADVEPRSQQSPIETIPTLALALFCMRIMFWGFFLFFPLLAYHMCYNRFMPNYESHPLRKLRRLHGLEMKELARLAGVSRATVSQMEEGRVKRPNAKVVAVLSRLSGLPVEELFARVEAWQKLSLDELMPRRGQSTLLLEPRLLAQFYRSFAHWRGEFADNPTSFASILRINRMTVAKYERGEFVGGMPDSLFAALSSRLGLSVDYVTALEQLPVGGKSV